MPPRPGDVWNVKGYGFPMICTHRDNSTLTLAPAEFIEGLWIACGMLRLITSFWGDSLSERIFESTEPWTT